MTALTLTEARGDLGCLGKASASQLTKNHDS